MTNQPTSWNQSLKDTFRNFMILIVILLGIWWWFHLLPHHAVQTLSRGYELLFGVIDEPTIPDTDMIVSVPVVVVWGDIQEDVTVIWDWLSSGTQQSWVSQWMIDELVGVLSWDQQWTTQWDEIGIDELPSDVIDNNIIDTVPSSWQTQPWSDPIVSIQVWSQTVMIQWYASEDVIINASGYRIVVQSSQ